MKSRLLVAAVACLGYAILDATPANADTHYYISDSDDWDEASYWDTASCESSANPGVPETGDNIVICDGKTVTMTVDYSLPTLHIEQNSVFVTGPEVVTVTGYGGLDIDPADTENDAPGKLHVNAGGELRLTGGGTHTIDGEIRIETSTSKFSIVTSSATLYSSASPRGFVKGEHNAAEIRIDDVTLTSSGVEMRGQMRFVDADEESPGSFTNQGKVIANADGTIDFAITGTIDDDGLDSDGNERWQVTASGAMLRFLEEPAAMEGRFLVSNGILQAGDDVPPGDDIDVVTTGNLTHTGGKIIAGVDDSFTFNN